MANRVLRNTSYFWQQAPLFRPLLLLVAGIIAYDYALPASIPFNYAIGFTALSGAGLIFTSLLRSRSAILEAVHVSLFASFFILSGFVTYSLSDVRNTPGWAFRNLDTSGITILRVVNGPQHKPATIKLPVEVISISDNGRLRPASGSALLYVYRSAGNPQYNAGDTLLVSSHWQAIHNAGNPFEFDNAAFQRRKGIFYQQFLAPEDVTLFAKATPARQALIAKAHNWCDKQLQQYIPDNTTLGLLQAMLLGDERGFDSNLREAYAQTGVIHIVSISGSHVAVLYVVVTGLLFWMRGSKGKWIKYLLGLILVWSYVLIAGAPPSALRSAIMFSVIALSTLTDREGQGLNTIVSAAFILLIAEPAWLFSVGFQLSFGAVLSMLLFYEPIYRLWFWPGKYPLSKWIWKAVAASIAAEVLTAPLVVYYFHNFPLLFIAGNLLAAVLAGVCALVGGMAIIALSWLPPVASLIGKLVVLLVQLFNGSILWLQSLNPDSLQRLHFSVFELLLCYVLIIALTFVWFRRHGPSLHLALAATCLLLFSFSIFRYKALGQKRLIVYNNGRHPLVELISGDRALPLVGNEEGYNQKAAHIGYGTSINEIRSQPPLISIGGKRVLILTDSTKQYYQHPFPVDILILARPLRFIRVGDMIQAFSPEEIVLAQRPGTYHLRRWTDSCAAYGIKLHNVSADGAYIRQ
jgi:competence protein ComEC